MKHVLLTAGPIPAALDSVKFITNRFKGGLALKTAKDLQALGNKVTLVCWEHLEIKTDLPVIRVKDVHDYMEKVLAFEADAYVLAAAVANLGPANPFEGKFPSHNYKVGDIIPIDFTIMPRVIDQIKAKHPRATLIAYKLFDGTDEQLTDAAWHTLKESRANLVFANHPAWAKEKKIVLTQDGAVFEVSFDDHVGLIHKLVNEKFYKTAVTSPISVPEEKKELLKKIIEIYPRTKDRGMTFGTFALRLSGEIFATTSRGKKHGEDDVAIVAKVYHESQTVIATRKATLNAPLLSMALTKNPHINFLLHDHKDLGEEQVTDEYQFPGTTGDLKNCPEVDGDFIIRLPNHGYLAGFTSWEAVTEFLGVDPSSIPETDVQ